ncbi:MAG: cysteine peptidase family C39 domain-containing protein, partial [Chlamydiota bacterium]
MISRLIDVFQGMLHRFRRVYTPTYIQMEATECGATSLMIILAYYKKFVPAATLRYQCGVT